MPSCWRICWHCEQWILNDIVYVVQNLIYLNHIGSLTRYSNIGRPRAFNRTGYDKCFKPLTSRVARLWIFSIRIMSFLNIGDRTDVAYTTCGQLRDLYKLRNISRSIYMYVKVLKISPSIWLAFVTLILICFPNFMFLSSMTPRSFSWSTFSTLIGPSDVSIVCSVFVNLFPIC